MRKLMLAAAFGLVGLAGAAMAQPETGKPGGLTAICLEPSGASRGAICDRSLNSSGPDFCRCEGATTKVKAEVCDPGEAKPPESAEFERARREAARDGSLVGDRYGDLRMCVRPTTALPGRAR
jgi:hypothetical protein